MKPHLNEFFITFPELDLCRPRTNDAHIQAYSTIYILDQQLHMISIVSEKLNDEGMTKEMLVKLNETLLKCGLNS